MSEANEYREFALKNFDRIGHPDLRTAWALYLFGNKEATPEIIKYLKAPERVPRLIKMLGPGFDEFKKKLKDAK